MCTTSRQSIPVGVPRKPSAGILKDALSDHVISYMRSVVAAASWGRPPTNSTIAGAAAIAKPPSPTVSVIVLSPMSRFASAAP